MIDWTEFIHADEKILLGKPVLKGTRLSVAFLLERLADGWTEEMLLENYPSLTKDGLKATFAYLNECMQDGLLYHHTIKKAA